MGRWAKGNAGYIPFVAFLLGAWVGSVVASFIGIPEWTLAILGLIGGYFLSRAILDRIYAPDDETDDPN
jgi:hypothetical protein